jgi:hypothetical protein
MTPTQIHPHTAPEDHRKILLALINQEVLRHRYLMTVWTPNGSGGITLIGGTDHEADIDPILFAERKSGWAFVYHRTTNEIEYYLRN